MSDYHQTRERIEAFKARATERLPVISRELWNLLMENENLHDAIWDANGSRPEGEPVLPLNPLAHLLSRDAKPEEIVSEEFVSRWVYFGTTRRLEDACQHSVRVDALNPRLGEIGRDRWLKKLELRDFRIVSYRKAVEAIDGAEVLRVSRVPELPSERHIDRTVYTQWEVVRRTARSVALETEAA